MTAKASPERKPKGTDEVHITVNKNTIHLIKTSRSSPKHTFGHARIDHTRNEGSGNDKDGEMIAAVISEPDSDEVRAKVKAEVAEITARFPMYKR